MMKHIFNFNEKLGNRIREERLKLGLTQEQLAESVNISGTYLGSIERGDRGVKLSKLVDISNRLGVTVDYLLSDSVNSDEENIINQFRQIMDGRSAKQKEVVLTILRNIFNGLDELDKTK